MASTSLPNYAVVSPVRDEQDYIRATLDSMTSQTILPHQWIIVDDGSNDQTPTIVSEYASNYPWIRLVRRKDQGTYRLGGGVVEAFYEGFNHIDLGAIEFICKLDADLVLEPDHFAQLLSRATADIELGIISGTTYFMHRGRRVFESIPAHHATGAARLWRVACLREIGGLVPALGWDALDEIRAQMRGWKSRSYRDIQIIHLRPMSSKAGWYKGRIRNGLTDYLLGYHPLFELARCFYRMIHPPYLIGGLLILYGYVQAAIRGERQIVTSEERRFFQRQQLHRLFSLNVR